MTVGIFKRKRRDADPQPDVDVHLTEPADTEPADTEPADTEPSGIDPADTEPSDADDRTGSLDPGALVAEDLEAAADAEPEPPFDRADGPFDLDEVEPDGSRLDLGALQVPALPGMQVGLEVDEAAQTVNAVQIALDGSHLQLQAFAAPRTSGLWPDIRTEIAQSIRGQGGSAEVVDGPLGRELTATLPGDGPAVRFLGVDGPRWFLRAVLSGPAATDEKAAVRLVQAVRGTVVVRGEQAMAPRELLALRMPATPEPEAAGAQPQGSTDDLRPFERGPEITEVR